MKNYIKYSELPTLTSQGKDGEMLHELQRQTYEYFSCEVNKDNGLIADKTEKKSPASISSTGLALCAYMIAVNNGYMKRKEAAEKTLRCLRFFDESKQGTQTNATGYKGFYYHYLDMKSGRRAEGSELSTIDTAILMAGIVACKEFYLEATADEEHIRELADTLYGRVNWQWAMNKGNTLSHG